MRNGRVWLIVVTLGLGLVVPAFAQPAGTLVVGLVAEPVNLDPAQVTDLNSNRVGRRIVETLVTFPEEKTEVVPGLAESWTISKDGLQYTFKLRKGITFHDGTSFNAASVKFSIERQINPDHPANKLGKYPFANYFFGNVKAVEPLSDDRVAFLLKEPRASFLADERAQAKQVFRHLLDLSATVTIDDDEVRVTLDKRAHNPYLVASKLTDQPTPMPWFGGKQLRIDFA
jgi:ABC-type transport system substrate-binding protein